MSFPTLSQSSRIVRQISLHNITLVSGTKNGHKAPDIMSHGFGTNLLGISGLGTVAIVDDMMSGDFKIWTL